MNPEIKARWVAALRSGEYRQGKGFLKTAQGTFCCLGVLCELAVQDGVIQPATRKQRLYNKGYSSLETWRYVDDSKELPAEVVHWADLDSTNPRIIHAPEWLADNERTASLATLNDSGRFGFSAIADLIENSLVQENPEEPENEA